MTGNEDLPDTPRPATRQGRVQPASRKLSLQSRLRGRLRRGADRVLGADVFWSGAFIAVSLLLVGSQRCTGELPELRAGQVAPFDIEAPVDFNDTDEVSTAEARQRAAAAVLEVYVHDTQRGRLLEEQVGDLFGRGRAEATGGAAEDGTGPRVEDLVSDGAALRALHKSAFDPGLERELKTALNHVMSGPIVSNKALLERLPAVTLITQPGRSEKVFEDWSSLVELADARQAVVAKVAERLDLSAGDERALGGLLAGYVDTNMLPDTEATRQRREEARSQVRPVPVPYRKGEVLLPGGETVTAEHVRMLNRARMASTGPLDGTFLGALAFVTALMAFFLYRYSRYHQRNFRKIVHLHALLVLMLLSMLLLTRGLLWLAGEVVDGLSAPYNQLAWYTYLIPLGAGSILVALLANGRIAMVYSAFVALLFGAMNGWSAYLIVWAMLVQCAGVYAISGDRERSALLRAALIVGVVGAASVVAMEALAGPLQLGGSLYGAALAFVGGAVGVGLLISFALPILEALFGVLTDIRLLELSNVNNPLLSQLAIKAPGSYNHSLVVGTLAEEAAKAIGASSLFCRVAAFYHDIGKMAKPEYYVENQRGVNPHDRLAPSMSALIIAAHVKDGIKMAREGGLPEQIVDIIPQHHGTKLMTYFYEKARRTADPASCRVKEEDFRYPGPKPQTREAAIFMLADSVEAAARTVEEPTPNRLRDMIQKISNTIVVDGQLEDCDLTFADLHRIQDAFLRLLISMYHHRVDYPGFDFNRREEIGPVEEETREPRERRVARGS